MNIPNTPALVEDLQQFLDLSVGMDLVCIHRDHVTPAEISGAAYMCTTPNSIWLARQVSF